MIRLRLLGCNGGVGSNRLTTCYALGETILVDAGTGISSLSLEQMARIDHILLTHAHFDHIACLPLLSDSVTALRKTPIQVWALPAVLDILQQHIFNDQVWPDFTRIPDANNPFIQLCPLPAEQPLEIQGYRISALEANHGIPAIGYRIEKDNVSLAFSGDTADCPAFWEAIQHDPALAAVIVECSYSRRMHEMAIISMHMDVDMVIHRLSALPAGVAGIIVHRKPGLEDEIAHELRAGLSGCDLRLPSSGDEYLLTARSILAG